MAFVIEYEPEDPGEGAAWVPVATYGMVYEAEFARATLESAGIPAHVHGTEHVAIFGPGWMGPSNRGITVLVPSDWADEARDLLRPEDEDVSA